MIAVDVITPVYNTPLRYLGAALDSLRTQTFSAWKAWIINDASDSAYTRQLEATLRSYGDSRIQYLYTEHKGPAGSRNVGIVKGEAPYIALLDSDDRWLPNHLSRQVAVLETNPEVALVHAHGEVIDAEGRQVTSGLPRNGLSGAGAPLFTRMLRENFVSASSVVVRRGLLERVGGFDDTFPCLVDKELWLRMLMAGARFHYDPEIVFQYRVHPGNISKKTDLLLATRRRIVEKVEALAQRDTLLAGVVWPALKREMVHHMHAEAAGAYLAQGDWRLAVKHSLPWRSGLSLDSCLRILHALRRAIRGR